MFRRTVVGQRSQAYEKRVMSGILKQRLRREQRHEGLAGIEFSGSLARDPLPPVDALSATVADAPKKSKHCPPDKINTPEDPDWFEPDPNAPPPPGFVFPDTMPRQFPPGKAGEACWYYFMSSIRPIPEVSLCGFLIMLVGIVARAWNIPSSGLNMYIVLLALTGMGKEDAVKATDRIFSEVQKKVPGVINFRGPARFASGPGLRRSLEQHPCFGSVLGEFTETFQALVAKNRNTADAMLHQLLLALYSKSAHTDVLGSTSYSQVEKNSEPVNAPNFSFLGETTPQAYFDSFDDDAISTGFQPRITTIQYNGERPAINRTSHAAPPPAWLVEKIATLAFLALKHQTENTFEMVQFDPEAKHIEEHFCGEADAYINGKTSLSNALVRMLWNRSHLKALRAAAALAVFENPYLPVVNKAQMLWATALERRGVRSILRKFQTGEVGGNGRTKAEEEAKKAIAEAFAMSEAECRRIYKAHSEPARQDGLLPRHLLRKLLGAVAPFRKDTVNLDLFLDKGLFNAGLAEDVTIEDKRLFGIRSGYFRCRPSPRKKAPTVGAAAPVAIDTLADLAAHQPKESA